MQINKPRNSTVGLLLAAPLVAALTGCLSDDRCDEGQRLEEGRCLPTLADGGADAAAPLDGGGDTDAAVGDGGGTGPCTFVPAMDQVVGTFKQTGIVDVSDCTVPMPTAGFAVDGQVALAKEGEGLVAKLEIVVSIEGGATIGDDGAVTISADGSLLDITFSAEERLCFADANSARGRASISLANPAGPLCSFELPVELARE